MAHQVICLYCGVKFDRDKEPFVAVNGRRYAHADCAKKAFEEKKLPEMPEIIDPSDTVICVFCKKSLSKKIDKPRLMPGNVWAHELCAKKEELKPKTDEDLLYEYILKLYNLEFVPPNIRLQIRNFKADYGFSDSGILKTLKYFYEIRGNKVNRDNISIGIVPYVYNEARRYYFKIWQAQQANQNITIKATAAQEVKIKPPKRKPMRKEKFTFLDSEVDNDA